MPVENKIDPFKPAQPAIPGVEASAEKPREEVAAVRTGTVFQEPTPSPARGKLIGVAAAGAALLLIMVGGLAYVTHMSGKTTLTANPISDTPVAQTELDGPAPLKAVSGLRAGPGPIASAEEISKPWSSKKFMFPDPVTSQLQPALVVHLPIGDYWAFSLREPFGTCELELVTDLKKLKTEYGFSADHPMVGDTCNHTVYDLLQYGGGAPGGLVRGNVVQGNGIRPPMAIEVRTSGKDIIAVRSE